VVSVRSCREVLALAASLLVGVACANRGMEGPSDLADGSGAGGTSVTDAGPDHPAGTGGAAGTHASGGAGGGAGARGGNAGGGSGGGLGSGGSGGIAGGTGGSGAGGSGGGAAGAGGRGGAGGGGGANAGGSGGAGAGAGGASTGGTGGSATGGAAGQMNTGGAGAGGGAGKGAGGVAGASSGGASGGAGAGGAGGTSSGGAGGQALPPLFAYYPFDQTAGPTIADASGNGHAGTLVGTGTFPAGVIGNALSLPGATGDYVALPSALLQSVTSVTITLWVNVRTDHTWQRIFDFGSSSSVYMFLTPHASTGNVARFAISTAGNTSEQQLNAPAVLPLATWTHVAIVLGAGGGTLYLNGASVATNASLTLRPSDLGAAANNWLGRSQFTVDPAFDGQIDELRIYASALTAAEVTAIYNAR
jgi:hypothetical protein